MTLPVCPNCRVVDNVEPDARQQGANRCRSCGYVGMVVEFHTVAQQSTTIRRGFKGLDELTKPRKVYQHGRQNVGPIRAWWLD